MILGLIFAAISLWLAMVHEPWAALTFLAISIVVFLVSAALDVDEDVFPLDRDLHDWD